MAKQLLDMTVLEAIRTDPSIVTALESVPAFTKTTIKDLAAQSDAFKQSMLALPQKAMVTGIASGDNDIRVGVYGASGSNYGVYGYSVSEAGVYGYSETSVGVYGASKSGLAGKFDGVVEVVDLRLSGADCAEEFEVAETEVEPGAVMVFDEVGVLRPCDQAYDRRVAGVVSGAGDYKPGITLDQQPRRRSRKPIALVGKVFCRVDADYAPISVGSLLTTSETAGCAMAAEDGARAFGSVIGKALRSLASGRGLIPVLIALQ